jgi:hypothetical protein
MRTLALPKTTEPSSLTSLREKLIKIGAKVVTHGRYVTFQAAEGAVSRQMFQGLAGTPQASINVAGIRAVRQRLEPSLYCLSIDPLCES